MGGPACPADEKEPWGRQYGLDNPGLFLHRNLYLPPLSPCESISHEIDFWPAADLVIGEVVLKHIDISKIVERSSNFRSLAESSCWFFNDG